MKSRWADQHFCLSLQYWGILARLGRKQEPFPRPSRGYPLSVQGTDTVPAPRTPLLATDIIIELADRPGLPIVLIRRRHPPVGWAIPGGFVDVGERLEAAAMREAREETSLEVSLKALLGCYSDPRRDPRGHTVSVVYIAESRGEPRAQDDAAATAVFSVDDLPSDLAFDHASILEDYRRYRRNGRVAAPRFPSGHG